MSELGGREGAAGFAGPIAANDSLTAGALLRRAREAAGLHVAALAVSLKVPVRKLEALEDDRWGELPDAAFVRALASSICRTLKIDPQPVLDRLPQTAAPRLIRSGEGLNTTFRAPSDGAASNWLDQLSRPVFLVVFALLLGALILILLPYLPQDEFMAAVTGSGPTAPAQPVTAPATVVEPSAPTGSLPAGNIAQPAPDGGAAPVSTPEAAPSPMALSTVTPATVTPAVAVPAAAETAAEPDAADKPWAMAAGDIIVFRTSSASWIEVKDAKGVVAVRRMMAAGDSVGASGALPLQVIIGRVNVTEVQVRGKPFDLRRVSRDNVARFEVK
jgi:cytoskeleton protein RodZ